ncbi:VanW family protein [Aquibacillus sp. 3ASR75-11]|uniref:VanW family protein n=1 Tax=Terrihalobacillus insolitus TaxID=2950438 RepID=A0A9X3WUD5_9BACI|nr:VanW family protein [Terrihalobacillus insolitus]MDC3425870.1 VanW family protein [Terrihalobacillus insolitus]
MKTALLSILFVFLPQVDLPSQINITDQGKTLQTVERQQFAIPYFGSPLLERSKLGTLMNKIDQDIYEEPGDATLSADNKIIKELPGKKLNRKRFKVMFYEAFYRKGRITIQIPIQTIYPKVDSELLDQIRVKKIGDYKTYYKTGNEERSHNITLATEAINNYVVFPGETFSFNKVVGKRTKEKGYLPAPVIVKGEIAEDVGGGICQVSSTLYNAVDQAGMEIVQRYSHSKSVPYVPPGRDATVSWYGPDFKFKNKYKKPILIRAKAEQGKMSVIIRTSEAIEPDSREVPSVSK